ncbi:MAG: MlaA family lipoprotein, partial [Pseudohongiella sp.]
PAGPYIVLPLFGPSTVRDGFGFATDTFTNPLNYREDVMLRNAAFVLQQVDRRVDAMSVDSLMSGDPYIFTREAYLQQREYLVKDGEVADQADDWGDWD